MTNTTLLVDGDIVKYSCGFASDSGDKIEPVEYALHSVKQLLNNIRTKTGADNCRVFLTGKDNYREKLATIKPYKGNRDRTKKPHWYNEIHEYLLRQHKAEVINNREADDAMGCEQWKSNGSTIICTLDKDLDMIPGRHYNWRKNVLYDVTLPEADLFFYTQLLTGDRTDNIVGVPGIGKKKAEKIVNIGMDNQQKYEAVLATYQKVYGDKAPVVLKENADLLWIQREENELWQVPSTP